MLEYWYVFITFLSFLCILQGFYFLMRFKKMLMVVQQSGYDERRMFKHIKENIFDVFPPGDLLIIIGGALVLSKIFFSGFIITTFGLYYGVRFFNMRMRRYDVKKPLAYTPRVKRIISSFILIVLFKIMCIAFLMPKILLLGLIFLVQVLNFMVFPILIICNIINKPYEKYVRYGFKKKAKEKLALNTTTQVIGITGSYGKTSIKNIVGEILQEDAPTLITPESFNTPMGLTITVNNYLNIFHKYFVAEMGAYYQGEIKELCDLVNPHIGIVSSVGPQHLETFKTLNTILKTKMELIESLPSTGLGILNYDSDLIRSYVVKNPVDIKWFSYENSNADIYASDVAYEGPLLYFTVNFKNSSFRVSTSLLGRHAVTNILASILVADYYKIDLDTIIRGISKLKPVKNRLEYKYINENLSILDDAFNSNEDGIKEAINILGSFEKSTRILITPGLLDLGSKQVTIHNELGRSLIGKVDILYVVGNYNKDALLEGVSDTNFDLNSVFCVDNFLDAYNDAVSMDSKKVILIANDFPDGFR